MLKTGSEKENVKLSLAAIFKDDKEFKHSAGNGRRIV